MAQKVHSTPEVDFNESQDATIDWLAGRSSNEERFEFFRRVLDVLPAEELNKFMRLVNNAKKRRARQSSTNRSEELDSVLVRPEGLRMSESIPVELQIPINLEDDFGEPVVKLYGLKDVLAVDVEKVEVPVGINETKKKKKRFHQRAGSVAVCDVTGAVVYSAKIYRAKGSYRTTRHSEKKNGLTVTSLQIPDCKALSVVQKELMALFEDKLIVGLELLNDIESLELVPANLNYYDLQWWWWRLNELGTGPEKLGLRSLCKFFVDVDVQPQGEIHTPENDAQWTMRLFCDKFCKLNPAPTSKFNPDPSQQIPHYK